MHYQNKGSYHLAKVGHEYNYSIKHDGEKIKFPIIITFKRELKRYIRSYAILSSEKQVKICSKKAGPEYTAILGFTFLIFSMFLF